MLKTKLFGVFILLLAWQTEVLAQTERESYQAKVQQAQEQVHVSLFSEATESLLQALALAEENGWKKEVAESKIRLAELKRKTHDFEEGLHLLRKMEKPQDPSLLIKQYGRWAALSNGLSAVGGEFAPYADSVFYYLEKALVLAEQLDLKTEQASLYNELGYSLGAYNIDSSLTLLNKAAALFLSLGDTANYVVAKTNIMRTYILVGQLDKVIPLKKELIHLSENDLYEADEVELEFLSTLAFYYSTIGDTAKRNWWSLKKLALENKGLVNTSKGKLNYFRALYETRRYQEQASQKAAELATEKQRFENGLIFFILAICIALVVSLLLLRERKLKRKIKTANERYQMLLVESNHRIKNNLQMIISMLEFSGQEGDKKLTLAYRKMSAKVQTIGALHKHLYLTQHNQAVSLQLFFEEISSLYQSLSKARFNIQLQLEDVKLKSERIVYFGLIFNEMLSNTLEHNPNLSEGINLKVSPQGEYYLFTYQDFANFKTSSSQGTGLKLIEQLVGRIEGFDFSLQKSIGVYQFKFYA
jgi:two-component sensor histidine kinase